MSNLFESGNGGKENCAQCRNGLFDDFYCNAQTQSTYYITADLANVRSQPKDDASIIARLKTGVAFVTNNTSDGWTFVDSVLGQEVKGWINLSLCSEQRVDTYKLDNK